MILPPKVSESNLTRGRCCSTVGLFEALVSGVGLVRWSVSHATHSNDTLTKRVSSRSAQKITLSQPKHGEDLEKER